MSNNNKLHFIVLSIGSNLGNRLENIRSAINLLLSRKVLDRVKCASIYETEPVGFIYQPWFLNTAVSGYTKLSPEELLQECKKIEKDLGRKTRQRWHVREIDIDIIFYENTIFNSQDLAIPHPRMHERNFVLVPLSEILPNYIHPKVGKTVAELLSISPDSSIVKSFNSN